MSYTDYPQGASNEAKRALKHREENGSNCGTRVGWARARQLADRKPLSESDVKSIHSFLSRAKVYDQSKFTENGKEICGSIMFAAWGGDSMVKWAAREAEKLRNVNAMKETRTINNRMTADAESRTVTGYAAIFNSESENLGGFIEIIEPGAFTEAIAVSDVRALFNHDENLVLARNTSGTLKLEEDETGLKYSFEAPNTQAGNDLLEMLKRGDITQSSFGFTLAADGAELEERSEQLPLRRIRKVKRLYDVSPVTYPAYPDTTVAKRSLESLKPNAEPVKVLENLELRILEAWLVGK